MRRQKDTRTEHRVRRKNTVETKLCLISEIAAKDRKCRFDNLIHLLNENNLKECFYLLKKSAACGTDGISFGEYERNLAENLRDLVKRMKQYSYRPQPVRRVFIPKADGGRRPLGIPAIEDKIVQMGISRILTAIYEADFEDFSYGFRPGRSCHDALNRLDKIIMTQPISCVIDADIKGFFGHVSHEWMLRCLRERISDEGLLRYIVRFLKSGVMEEGNLTATTEGTPQGGIISPILANIYLHYVLDLWFRVIVSPRCSGTAGMVRYADDFVICTQNRDDAENILRMLRERLGKFGLSLSEEKTRLIGFGRNAEAETRRENKRTATFNFLGFTHFCDRTRKGGFKVGRVTDRKRFRAKIKETVGWLKKVRNLLTGKEIWRVLSAKLRGHFQYYGVSGNYQGMKRFYFLTVRAAYRWLNRRSQKKSFNWEEFREYLRNYPLPKPKIFHNFYTLYGR